MKCKVTNKKLKPFMSFGKMPIANGFLGEDKFTNEFFFNMEVGFSEDISLFQLNDHPKPEFMFNENYPFFTSSSEFMKLHFKNFSNYIKKKYLNTNSKIIEIGSNDGTLLKNFVDNKSNILGYEPSKNVADLAIKMGIPTINDFFNLNNASNQKIFLGSTDLIMASNCICHIPNLNDLIEGIDLLLSKDGTFIFEEPYLGSMYDKTSYDQIYDEHIYIFSLSAISKIFKLKDFELVDAAPQITHGGSMRYVIKRKKKSSTTKQLIDLIEKEKMNKIDTIEAGMQFKANCENSKKKTKELLKNYKSQGKKICGYAATSKSTTILNYCGIDRSIIDFICDTTPEKIGKFSPGVHIPIVDINYFHNNLPDVAYLFAWNHKNEILAKEKNYHGEWFSHVTL